MSIEIANGSVAGYIHAITWLEMDDGRWEAMLFIEDDPPSTRSGW